MDADSCPGCRQRDDTIADLRQRLADLEQRVQQLHEQLGKNARNSSIPPSANPPQAAKPVTKKSSGRASGAQPGHPAHLRRRLPPQRIQQHRDFLPSHCQRCHESLSPMPAAEDPEPTWHQVAELPKLAAEVTEYRGHFRTCATGGTLNHAAIPADLAVEESLWTFVRVEGVEPTNNHSERMLRLAVLWRKKSFGSQSDWGCRFVERLLRVVQTRRLQGQSVLDYLYEALVAHRAGLPAPKLL